MLNQRMRTDSNFQSISVSVASPDSALSWSYGEVKKPETINYRTQKPERDGLFCERIFGPTKNYECFCGKYKRIRYRGIICEKCGVEVTHSSVRRKRMGHIKLAVPVSHIWYVRSTPSRIGLFLNLSIKELEKVIYFAAYLIYQVDENAKKEAHENLKAELKKLKASLKEEYQNKMTELQLKKKNGEIKEKDITEFEEEHAKKVVELDVRFQKAQRDLDSIKSGKVISELEYRELSMKFGYVFKAGIGAEVIKNVLTNIDLAEFIEEQKKALKKGNPQKNKKTMKRLKLASSMKKAGIRPEWMILTVLPVIPPDLRPMVQLDGGRFAASDLNDLYRRVINRNNRLGRLISICAPEVICRNEKRMLQEAVDSLIHISPQLNRPGVSFEKRKLRSLSDMLKGKQGCFRQNLLGKRVDYSGRSVIVVGPNLRLHECGLPKEMALELFKPFVIGLLIREGYVHNVKSAEKLIELGTKEVWDMLERAIQDRFVLLNRAPTLHRLGIQAFQPKLVEGKAIQIHPLVCAAFNADFDGDQMAVHIPLSKKAIDESREIMLSARNLLKPSSGEPITGPTQDMVLGCYYLTFKKEKDKGEGKVFSDLSDAVRAYRSDAVSLHAKIKARVNGKIMDTTVGRYIFNSFIPEELGYRNYAFTKKKLTELISECYDTLGDEETAKLSDNIKRIGFKFASKSGLSIAIDDMIIPEQKYKKIEESTEAVRKIQNQYWKGFVSEHEKYTHTVKIWSDTKNLITQDVVSKITRENDLYYMIDSGARGNWGQVTQLCGMKGLVANPAGKTIELPIKSNLKEGFTILEYFIATHGGRKGKSDTALKTAEAGYLTRRLVDAVQDVIIKEEDCGSEHKHDVTRKESDEIGESFERRIFGRTLAEDLVEKNTGEIIAEKNEEINNKILKEISAKKVDSVKVRSVMTCRTIGGICKKCYGRDLGRNKSVELGTPIGIIAAQSIGEPGTQLTMRTFHMGGVAGEGDITQGLSRVEEIFEARHPKSPAKMAQFDGTVKISRKKENMEIVLTADKIISDEYDLPLDFELVVKKGDRIEARQILAKKKYTAKNSIRAKNPGKVQSIDKNKIVVKHDAPLQKIYNVSLMTTLKVQDGDKVKSGDPLTEGHLDPQLLKELVNSYAVQKYIVREVQSIYSMQGQSINDKHIEVIVRQMFSKVRVSDSGNSKLLPGEIVNYGKFLRLNEKLREEGKKEAKGDHLLLGITRTALFTDSWLSAASFQETIRVLVEAATTKNIDKLEGLKENVIIGRLIPAGKIYRKEIQDVENQEQSKI